MFLRIGRPALIVLALSLLVGACSDHNLGTQVTGNIIQPAAPNIRLIPAARREPPFTFQHQSFRFTAKTIDGETISSDLLAGKPAVVNFWGAWCGDCHREQPMFDAAYQTFSAKVTFLGVDVRDPFTADARSFVEQYKIPYPSVYDPYSDVAYKFNVVPFPVTYILDAQSRVAAVISSLPESQSDLNKTIQQVLT